MYNFATMKIFESFGDLINDIPNVDVFEDIFRDNIVEICLHKLKNEINISVVFCLYCIVYFYDVAMIDLPQYFNLSVGPLRVCGVLEGVKYFFKCVYFFSVFFLDLPNVPVSS